MKCGIEFEYLFADQDTGKIRDFTNLGFKKIQPIISAAMPGTHDPHLKKGDIGIKTGYWYLEGDERFDEKGNFVDCEVKGIEIRTPITSGPHEAIQELLRLETQLAAQLQPHKLELRIIGFNPVVSQYTFNPPLNVWEQQMRQQHHEYDAADVSNLSYGPDINLSFEDMDEAACLQAAQRLTYYSPFMVPFSFSSPFYNHKLWRGLSKRTFERTWRRPAARVFINSGYTSQPPLTHAPRLSAEAKRIEFKAYDAILGIELLQALTTFTLLVIRNTKLSGKTDTPDKALHQRAALLAFDDAAIYEESQGLLKECNEFAKQHYPDLAADLQPLEIMLAARQTPAHHMRTNYQQTGKIELGRRLGV